MTVYARHVIGDPTAPEGPPALNLETATIAELGRTLAKELEAVDTEGFEYFGVSCEIKYKPGGKRLNEPIGHYRWIACYAVTGTSEGHYIHVDRIYQAKPHASWTHEQLFLGKTFGGYDVACKVAAYLGRRLGA